MKKIFLLVTLVIGFVSAFAQNDDSTKYIWYKFQYGFRQPRVQADSIMTVPRDTAHNAKYGSLAVKKDTLYFKDSTKWVQASADLTKLPFLSYAKRSNYDTLAKLYYTGIIPIEVKVKTLLQDQGGYGTLDRNVGGALTTDTTISHIIDARVVGVKSAAELRSIGTLFAAVDTQFVVQLTNYTLNYTQYYQYDPNDVTSVDNGATIIKAGSKVFRAIFPAGVVNVKIFGATGNGSTDDQPFIQNACDILVANPSLPRNLYFPKGAYKITKSIIIYKWDGTQYQQCNVNLIGQEYQHWNDITTVARIILTDANSFAIGIQQGRSMVIKGLSIEGVFNPGGGINDAYYKRSFANWASDYGVRDQPQSPYSGINIDPFSNSASFIPADGGYPAYTSWYRGTMSNGGSSGIHVEQCRIFGFTVGIGISLNSWTQNGEDMVFRDNAITICKVAYASGQLQTKDNFIYNGITDDRVYAIVSGDYGSGHGCQPYIMGYNIAGAVISVCHGLSSQFPVVFQNIFAEGLFQIGDAQTGAGVTEFIGCNLDFTLFTTPIAIPTYHWKGDNVKFKGCTVRYYDDSLNKRLYFNGGQITFDNCWFDKPPLGKFDQGASVAPIFSFNECRSGDAELIGWKAVRGELSNSGFKIVKYGSVDVYDDGGTFTLGNNGLRSMHLHFDFGGLNRFIGVASGVTVTVDTIARKATFTIAAGQASLIAAGDYLLYGPAHDSVLGKITSVNYSTGAIAVTNVPIGIKTAANFDLEAAYYEIARGAIIGKVLNGSNIIDSVKFLQILGQPQVGDRSNIGYPGSIITAISGTQITLSTTAYYTRSQDYGPLDRSEKIDVTSYYDPSHANLDGWNFLIPQNTIWKIWTSPYTNVQHTYEFNKGGYIHMSTVSGPPTYWQSQWSLTSDNNWDAWRITEGKNRLMAAGTYGNYGLVEGTSGYGFFDNGGVLQFKNSGGAWDDIVGRTTTQTLSNKTLSNKVIISGNVTAANWGLTGIGLVVSPATFTDNSTAGSGTVADVAAHVFDAPTFAASNASVVFTRGYNVYFKKPINGSNVTVTNKYSIGIEGDAYFNQHIAGNRSFGSITAGTGEGTSGSRTLTGGDIAGKIDITTGTGPATSATLETIVFSNAYIVAPLIVLTPGNSAAAALSGTNQVYVDAASISTTQFVIKTGSVALGATTQYIWFYHILQ